MLSLRIQQKCCTSAGKMGPEELFGGQVLLFLGLAVKSFTKSTCILYSHYYQAISQRKFERKLWAFKEGLTKNKPLADIKII